MVASAARSPFSTASRPLAAPGRTPIAPEIAGDGSPAGQANRESPATILIVDDDREIRDLLSFYLIERGFLVLTAENSKAMRAHLEQTRVDLVLLDLVLPGDDGLTIARELSAGYNPGIIMVTGMDDEVERIVGLEVGADDFVTKPLNLRELLARIRSVLRRVGERRKPQENQARFAGWSLDLQARELEQEPDGRRIDLTAQEFKLLELLVRSAGRDLTRRELFAAISSKTWQPSDRTIDGAISNLRRKLETDSDQPTLIKSVRGVGYLFAADVSFE